MNESSDYVIRRLSCLDLRKPCPHLALRLGVLPVC